MGCPVAFGSDKAGQERLGTDPAVASAAAVLDQLEGPCRALVIGLVARSSWRLAIEGCRCNRTMLVVEFGLVWFETSWWI